MLLGAAKLLKAHEDQIKGHIKLVFQVRKGDWRVSI
jgi:metal-dependent amidase/aminoacylase/carboxypeptidase family protein